MMQQSQIGSEKRIRKQSPLNDNLIDELAGDLQQNELGASRSVLVELAFESLTEAIVQFNVFAPTEARVEIAKVGIMPNVPQVAKQAISHWGVGVNCGGSTADTMYFEVTGTGAETKHTAIALPRHMMTEEMPLEVLDHDQKFKEAYTSHGCLPDSRIVRQGVSAVFSPEIPDKLQFVKAWVNGSSNKCADGSIEHPSKLACSREHHNFERHFFVGRTNKTDEEIKQFCHDWVKQNPFYHLIGTGWVSPCNCQNFSFDLCRLLTGKTDSDISAKVGSTDNEFWWRVAAGAIVAGVAVATMTDGDERTAPHGLKRPAGADAAGKVESDAMTDSDEGTMPDGLNTPASTDAARKAESDAERLPGSADQHTQIQLGTRSQTSVAGRS